MTDRRTFKDRRDVFSSEKNAEKDVAPIEKPKAKIRHVEEAADSGFNKNKHKNRNAKKVEEERNEEEHEQQEEEKQTDGEEHQNEEEEEEAAPEE